MPTSPSLAAYSLLLRLINMTTPRRRFIANAVCPQCGLIDKICLYIEEHDERIACINCDYQERKSEITPPEKPTTSNEHTVVWHKPIVKKT